MAGARLVGALIALGLLGAACGAPRSQPGGIASEIPSMPAVAGHDVNVTGTLEGGAAAACPSGEPCDPHMVAATLIFSSPGKPDATARVGADGSFALHLDPGDYEIAPAPPSSQGKLEPSEVRVPGTGTVTLRLRIVPSS